MDAESQLIRPNCWGIGLARTGTTSFCDALQILGYRHVVHNPRFEQLATMDGGADNGVVLFYKYLDFKFPGSKFVLMLRDIEAWVSSMDYIFSRFPVRSRDEDIAIARRMHIYETVSFDRNKLIASYIRHTADVRRYFANRPNDLIEMNISDGQGWEVLCPFLGLPTPPVSFPHLNAKEADELPQREMPRTVFSFVVDTDARFAIEARHLARSLVRHAGGDRDAIHVQCTPGVPQSVRQHFLDQGYHVHTLVPFGDEQYCNKLAQLDALSSVAFDIAILLDTDMIAVSDPRVFAFPNAITGKIVDLPNPSIATLDEIARVAGIATLPALCRTDAGVGETYLGNCNGGFYAVPKAYCEVLSKEWKRWALWLLENNAPLRAANMEAHVDQVSFWMAIQSANLPFQPAPSNVNYYVHFTGEHHWFDRSRDLALLHYHEISVDVGGLLVPPAELSPVARDAIARANEQIAQAVPSLSPKKKSP